MSNTTNADPGSKNTPQRTTSRSEDIRRVHGDDYDNYGVVRKTREHALKNNPTIR